MEVKFKNGDSVAIPEGCKAVVKDNVVVFEEIKQKFKKGDFVYGEHLEFDQKFVFIFKKNRSSNSAFDEAALFLDRDSLHVNSGFIVHDKVRLATESEKQLLIAKLRENGKDWDAEKLEIVDYRWRAKKGEFYFIIDNEFNVKSFREYNDIDDNSFYSCGNYFKTRELAEQAAEKIKELLLTLKHS